MAKRDAIINFLDTFLDSPSIPDDSQNGLQVQGREDVKKIVCGVSCSLEFFKAAAEMKADMVLTHHGLIWGQPQRITGVFGGRVSFLIQNGISLAAYHLPLDKHKTCGNNAVILGLFGAKNIKPFGKYHGMHIGFKGTLPKPVSIRQAADTLEKAFGGCPATVDYGPEKIRAIGVVSGGAAGLVNDAAAEGLDLFITGETAEYVPETCRETGINFIAGGHYNTEKAGVTALMPMLRKKFGISVEFADVPNPF